MLSFDDQAQLAAAMCATAETLGQTLSANAADLMSQDLASYSVADIAAALQACRRELTGKLTLAAILQRVQAADGRPGDDEAWALALRASDETDSVVLTEEILIALGAARAVLDAGDKIGARMAFKGAYLRAVDAARREAKPAKWSLSMGYDPARRLSALADAGRQGRLPAPEVARLTAEITQAPITADGVAIAGLLTGNVTTMPSGEIRERWQAVRAAIKAKQAERQAMRHAEAEAHAEDFQRRRAAQLAAIGELEGAKQP